MTTSKEMTAGPALPLIFNFTLPLLLGNLLQQTYSLVDAAIVGKLQVVPLYFLFWDSAMDVVVASVFLLPRSSEHGITVR